MGHIVAGKYDLERANWVIGKGYADLVAFGRPFVANPDLLRRLAEELPLAEFAGVAWHGASLSRPFKITIPWPSISTGTRSLLARTVISKHLKLPLP
ncbi:hypothetical protein JFU37_24605 [Pseudomonas sp. TH41]|uniref:oxidoreductase n=1 Tax=Pseudomonas sp. TH41 TaxID=2796405 RepID=UPI001911A0B7|nr:hypothetical protein [Pseudomonas sp. TH41]MBK5355671.1 hypothetical protein [Pseudomonas sp. TH41]